MIVHQGRHAIAVWVQTMQVSTCVSDEDSSWAKAPVCGSQRRDLTSRTERTIPRSTMSWVRHLYLRLMFAGQLLCLRASRLVSRQLYPNARFSSGFALSSE